MCVETFGTWCKLGKSLIQDIGGKLIEQTGEKRSTAFLFHSLGMAIQRGNAITVLGAINTENEKLEEIYNL